MITKHSLPKWKAELWWWPQWKTVSSSWWLWWPSWTGASIREWPESVRVTKGTQLELQVASKQSPNSNFILKCTLFCNDFSLQFFMFSLQCAATGDPAPIISWLKEGTPVSSSSSSTSPSSSPSSSSSLSSLFLLTSSLHHQRAFVCFRSLWESPLITYNFLKLHIYANTWNSITHCVPQITKLCAFNNH